MADADRIREERLRRDWSQTVLAEQARQFVDEAERDKLVQQVVGRVEAGKSSKYKDAIMQALGLRVVLTSDHINPNTAADKSDNLVAMSAAQHQLALSGGGFRSPALAAAIAAFKDAPEFRTLAGPRDVQELGVAIGGKDGDFDFNGEVIGFQPRPPGLMTRDVFAVRVQNDSMHPRFRDGEMVYVERRREPAVGEDAIIELKPEHQNSVCKAFIKEIVSKNSEFIVAKQHNPPMNLTFNRSCIKALYRVVPWNECFGV